MSVQLGFELNSSCDPVQSAEYAQSSSGGSSGITSSGQEKETMYFDGKTFCLVSLKESLLKALGISVPISKEVLKGNQKNIH